MFLRGGWGVPFPLIVFKSRSSKKGGKSSLAEDIELVHANVSRPGPGVGRAFLMTPSVIV